MKQLVCDGVLVVLTCLAAITAVVLITVASIFLVFSIKAGFVFIANAILLFGEIFVALIAAFTSAATVSLSVILAAGAASMTFPAYLIEARIGVSVAVSGASIVAAATTLIMLASLKIDWEIVSAVVTAAAMSVAFAAAWAVGVMSLIEKETQQVGLKMTSILDAVRRNNYRILRVLLKLHAGLKQRDLDLGLLHAVKATYSECTEVLLSAGANANTKDSHENTPLVLACETGSYKLAQILLDAGGQVDIRNGSRGTALHYACKWGYEDCVRLLLSRQANPNIQDGLWRTPLMLAARHAHQAENVMRMLIEAGSDVDIMGTEQRTALHYASARGLDVDILLNAGADPHNQDTEGNSPLHHAAMEGCLNVIRSLLSFKCDPNLRNYQRRTPLHFASMRGEHDCIIELVDAGSDPNIPDNTGCLPMWYAASKGHFAAVRYFIRRNCPLKSYTDKSGAPVYIANPLDTALEKNHFAVARMLLIGGCNSDSLTRWLTEHLLDLCIFENHHLDWLKEFVIKPCNLSHFCRLKIRQCLGTDLNKNISFLPLPKTVRSYVMLMELEYEEWTEVEAEPLYQTHVGIL